MIRVLISGTLRIPKSIFFPRLVLFRGRAFCGWVKVVGLLGVRPPGGMDWGRWEGWVLLAGGRVRGVVVRRCVGWNEGGVLCCSAGRMLRRLGWEWRSISGRGGSLRT